MADHKAPPATVRLDKWLWAARFFKTRSLATEEIAKGRVRVNGAEAKPSRDLRPGDEIAVRGEMGSVRTVKVLALSAVRGPAPVARLLYEETAESLALQAARTEQRRLAPEPALSIDHGRPTKRDRRALDGATGWDDRWSARLDRSN